MTEINKSGSGYVGFIVGDGGQPTYYTDLEKLKASVVCRERRGLHYSASLLQRGGWQFVSPRFDADGLVESWVKW